MAGYEARIRIKHQLSAMEHFASLPISFDYSFFRNIYLQYFFIPQNLKKLGWTLHFLSQHQHRPKIHQVFIKKNVNNYLHIP